MSTLCRRQNRKPVSVLTCHLSSRPTPRKRAGSPPVLADVPVYMVFLVLVPSPSYVATRRRELLPHGFTLTLAGGLFSVTAFIRLLPSVLSTAGCPFQSGLSSELPQRQKRSTYMFSNMTSICIRACAPFCHFACSSSQLPLQGQE